MEPSDEPTDTDIAALDDAFRLLANETRLEILRALWDAPSWTATYSELKDAVELGDSGTFQYHLRQLTGTFIEQTDDGYHHLTSGITVVRAMLSAVNASPEPVEAIPLEARCSTCDTPYAAVYVNQVFEIQCRECDEHVFKIPFPPAGLQGRSAEERIAAFDRWSRRLISLACDGVCPWCSGAMSTRVLLDDPEPFGYPVRVDHECAHCDAFFHTSLGHNVFDHPAVVGFFTDHGFDVDSVPLWDLGFCSADAEVAVLRREPLRTQLQITLDSETLRLVFDDEAAVVESERES